MDDLFLKTALFPQYLKSLRAQREEGLSNKLSAVLKRELGYPGVKTAPELYNYYYKIHKGKQNLI